MTTNRLRSLLAALVLLVSPASASAECAWVLWRLGTVRPPGEPEWVVTAAGETLDQCRAARTKALADFRQLFDASGLKGRTTDTTATYGGEDEKGKPWVRIYTFECLPDTIDPRGPKGTG